jgi:DNA invertase Pin-like site-specific DNA recombinase
MAGIATFERDTIRERVKSGLAAARAMHSDGLSYRFIGRNLGLSKSTVMEIVRRAAA